MTYFSSCFKGAKAHTQSISNFTFTDVQRLGLTMMHVKGGMGSNTVKKCLLKMICQSMVFIMCFIYSITVDFIQAVELLSTKKTMIIFNL